jgi:hypothetical protein
MVARISTGRSLYGALAYNERKVQQGEATALGAIYSLADADKQGLYEKARTLQSLAERNERTKRNTYHVALSFAKGDRLDAEQLRAIARDYLEGIGFGGQPAYLYRHHDTANDHVHIVTTNIRADGKRIADSFLGATKSEETRRAIEAKYQLVRAEEQQAQQRTVQGIGNDTLKHHARHSIQGVLKEFRPASLEELNAVLRGAELRIRQHEGQNADGTAWRGYTVDRIDGRTGKDVSASIKASQLFATGWSGRLEGVFAANGRGKEVSLAKLRGVVREAFGGETGDPAALRERLQQGGVGVIEHRNAEGYLYGLHYVHHGSGHVFKASAVGKRFTAAAWREREQTDRLSDPARQELEKQLQEYMRTRAQQLGLRSAAIQRVSLRELQDHVAQLGHQLVDATPYLKAFRAAEQGEYDKVLQRDRAEMAAVQRGIERLQPEYRRRVLEAAGMVVAADGRSTHRHNADLALRPTRGVAGSEPLPPAERIGPLSGAERKLLLQLGRPGGVGGLAQSVHLGSLDWPAWKERLPPARSRAVEERLHRNLVQTELQRAARRRDPVGYLLGRGVVVEPANGTYTAYLYTAPGDLVEVKAPLAGRITAGGYRAEDYHRIRERMADPAVKQLLQRAETRQTVYLKNNSGNGSVNRAQKRKSGLPFERFRTKLSGLIRSTAPTLFRQGLYDLLRNTDQEENPEVRPRRQQLRLSD